MACPTCGSWAVKADRSLGGRMVCARCGQPLGIGAKRLGRRPARVRISAPGRSRLWLGISALVLVSALLAWRAEHDSTPSKRLRLDTVENRSGAGAPQTLAG